MMEALTKFGPFLFASLLLLLIPPGYANRIARGIQQRCYPSVEAAVAECCEYEFMSIRFGKCCKKYHCCPICPTEKPPTENGCCYVDKSYTIGTVVAQFPEFCVELVCGAIKIKPPIYYIHARKMTPCEDPCGPSTTDSFPDQHTKPDELPTKATIPRRG